MLDSLRPFCDPATEFNVIQEAGDAVAEFLRFGSQFLVRMPSDGRILLTVDGEEAGRFHEFRSLLASSHFCDLRGFAETQRRVIARDIGNEGRIEVDFTLDGGVVSYEGVFRALTNGDGQLSVYLIDGPAGAGKTHLIQKLSHECANKFLLGESVPLVLHVSSRGGRLSNLRDVIAKTTQSMRARFGFDEVPVLVREGLIVLAIDGFDELVDQDGYKDAWFALRDNIDELKGRGKVILSGRDTFFDQQKFYERLNYDRKSLGLMSISVNPVKPDVAKRWLVAKGWRTEDIQSEIASEVICGGSFVLRPFFLARLGELGGWPDTSSASLRHVLMQRFIEREAHLLGQHIELPVEAVKDAVTSIYGNIAMDMAERQSEVVDLDFMGLLCELFFEGKIPSEDVAKLRHKIGSIALLERDISEKNRRFPHQEIMHYFLARQLVKEVSGGANPLALRALVVTGDFIEVFGEEIESFSKIDAEGFISAAVAVLKAHGSRDRLYANLSSLVLTSLRNTWSREFGGVDFVAEVVGWRDAFPDGAVSTSWLGRVDARDADISSVYFGSGTEISSLLVTPSTVLGITLIGFCHIFELVVEDGIDRRVYRDAEAINLWIAEHASSDKEFFAKKLEATPIYKFFNKICRKMSRHHAIREDVDDELSALFRDPMWAILRPILEDADRLEYITRPMKGVPSRLIRIRNPMALLSAGSSEESDAIRRKVWLLSAEMAIDRMRQGSIQ